MKGFMLGILTQQETENDRKLLREIAEAAKKMNLYSDTEFKTLSRLGKKMSCFTVYESNFISIIHARIRIQECKNEPKKNRQENRGPRMGQSFFKYPKGV